MLRSFLLLCAGACALSAQTSTGTLFGVARDSSGGAVAGVAVTATQVDTSFSRKTTTDDKGEYLITNLPIGQYSLVVEKAGFRRFIQEGITLEVNENARVDVLSPSAS